MTARHRETLCRLFASIGAVAAIGSGCAPSLDFNSPSPLGKGVSGKTWRTPYLIDSSLYIPSAFSFSQTASNGLVKDFDLAVSGSSLQLAGTWWDSSTVSSYRGYARLYQDGSGWSSIGPSYAQIGTDANSLVTASVAAGPGGLFMANFFADPLDALHGTSAAYGGASWQVASNNLALSNAPTAGTRAASAIDSVGRGFVFYADATAVWETQWGLANPSGIAAAANQVSTGATQSDSTVTARFDGVKQVCVTFEDASANLKANCEDVSQGGPYDFASGDARTIATLVAGHDTATDGAGHEMTVLYKGSGTSYRVYGFLATNGSWPTSLTLLDSVANADGYKAPWPSGTYSIPGARPGVAYVGSGRYLAVWVGVNTTISPPATQLYSALYDPDTGGWAAAEAIGGTMDSFSTAAGLPHARSLTVFGNGDGNAGYALNKIHTTATIGGTNPGVTVASQNIYPEAAQVRVTEVNRWHIEDKWLGATTYKDFPCFNAYNSTSTTKAATGSGASGDCTHAPVGAVLPSGESVVLFQAIDGYSSGLVPGNRRLMVLEFK